MTSSARDEAVLDEIRELAGQLSDQSTQTILQSALDAVALNPQPEPPGVLDEVALNPQPLPPHEIDVHPEPKVHAEEQT